MTLRYANINNGCVGGQHPQKPSPILRHKRRDFTDSTYLTFNDIKLMNHALYYIYTGGER